jgi:aminobutyraldehyde dehydrogenase
MELGGKAPVIVFDDADIDAVVEGVRTFGFYNAGQDCTAACRIYAQAGIYDQLVEKLGAAVASLKMGPPEDATTELGPLSSQAHLDRVCAAVDAARALPHIQVVTGSKAPGTVTTISRRCWRERSRKMRLSSARSSVRWSVSPRLLTKSRC